MTRTTLLATVSIAILLSIGSSVKAQPITTDVLIAPSGEPGSVQQLFFMVTTAGDFDIDAQGSPSLGAGFNSDPMIFLFFDDGSLDTGDFIESNDDFFGLESRISVRLEPGDYLLSVSEFFFDIDQAISGIEDSIGSPNTFIRVSIDSGDGFARFAAVPEPSLLPIFGIGMATITRRRRSSIGT